MEVTFHIEGKWSVVNAIKDLKNLLKIYEANE